MTRITVTVPGVVFDNSLFADGWQLSDVDWWNTTAPRLDNVARPAWHGDFGQGDVFAEARYVTVSGVFQSYADPGAVTRARDVLAALHELGVFDFTVDDGQAWTVRARLASTVRWDVDHAPGCAAFEFTVKADDPRRYGPALSAVTGVPTPGVGIADPIIDPITEGAPGNLGRVTVANTGTAPTEPVVTVTGGLTEGFELVCIETGRVVRVTRPIPDGSFIRVDMGAGVVWVDGQSPLAAAFIPVSDWFQVPPSGVCTIQFTPLGVQTGTPSMSVEWAVASW